jgi:hypothetical protein
MIMRVVCPEGHPVLVDATRRGAAAICPRCFASFLVEMDGASAWHARKEDSKARQPRDDDDDEEDEEERPRRKTTPKKAKQDDEEDDEETPRRKKQSRKKVDEEEEEDEDEDEEEDDEEGEPEEPIEWTPRKRQLNICAHGLIAMVVACNLLIAFVFFSSIWIDFYELNIFGGARPLAITLFNWISLPLAFLGLTAFVVGMMLNLAAPAKAEAKGALIAAIVFAGLIYVLGLLTLLTMFGALFADPDRAKHFVQLLVVGSLVGFILCMVSTMAYLAKLMIFMKLHLDSSQPITNIGFILLAFALLFGLVYASPLLKTSIADWVRFVVAPVGTAIAGFAIYMLTVQARLITRVRRTIGVYIKEG